MSELDKMNEMSDVELFHLIKNPSCKLQYNKAFATLYNRYQRLFDKQWYMLVKQLNCGWTNNYKEDFYSLASEAFMMSIDRADESKFQDNFKFVQMVSWLVGNVRINLIKDIIKRESKLESVYGVDKDSENKLNVKSRVEIAYSTTVGYMDNPEHAFEQNEVEDMLNSAVEICRKRWSPIKTQIYGCLSEGLTNTEIATKLGITNRVVSHTISLMKKEIKRELTKIARKNKYI